MEVYEGSEVLQTHHVILVAVRQEELLSWLLVTTSLGLCEPVTPDAWQPREIPGEGAHHSM